MDVVAQVLFGMDGFRVLEAVADPLEGELGVLVETIDPGRGSPSRGVVGQVKQRPLVSVCDATSAGRRVRVRWRKRRWACMESDCERGSWTEQHDPTDTSILEVLPRPVQGWSPEQIARRLRVDFPDDESMRLSHEAIYQALYVQGRGALQRELVACLRTGRALRVPRARGRQKAWAHVSPEVMISQRPAEVEDRAVPGHWGGDLVIGLQRSAIGTLVERTTRFTMLIHLPREDGYGVVPRTKNGPALAGYGAITMKDALAATMTTLPEQLRRSLTWDRGKELSAHVAFKIETGISVYFADPKSPWQRGTNENTNGLLRQLFPKGTDLSRWTAEEIETVASTINSRPRKTLGWKTPAEALDEHLRSLQQAGVATTD